MNIERLQCTVSPTLAALSFRTTTLMGERNQDEWNYEENATAAIAHATKKYHHNHNQLCAKSDYSNAAPRQHLWSWHKLQPFSLISSGTPPPSRGMELEWNCLFFSFFLIEFCALGSVSLLHTPSLTHSTHYFLIISAKWSVIIYCICALKVRHHIAGKVIIRQQLGDAVQAHLTEVPQIPHETAALLCLSVWFILHLLAQHSTHRGVVEWE